MVYQVYVLLGGNVGDTRSALSNACIGLEKHFGRIGRSSALYQTEPWGMQADTFFVNQALLVSSKLHPRKMLKIILKIENDMGRIRSGILPESRIIDIDLLFVDSMIICEPGLEIPHPRLHLRRFALQPLCDIAPDFIHPVLGVSIQYLLDRCDDPLRVNRLPGLIVG